MDSSQRTAALEVIHEAHRPLLFVYIHGWQNNANSADVCRFEHFIDPVSRYPEITGRKINVIGVYIAWRGEDVTLPVAKFLTFWSRKGAGGTIADGHEDRFCRDAHYNPDEIRHGGLWSDNSVAMLGAIFRIHFHGQLKAR